MSKLSGQVFKQVLDRAIDVTNTFDIDLGDISNMVLTSLAFQCYVGQQIYFRATLIDIAHAQSYPSLPTRMA